MTNMQKLEKWYEEQRSKGIVIRFTGSLTRQAPNSEALAKEILEMNKAIDSGKCKEIKE